MKRIIAWMIIIPVAVFIWVAERMGYEYPDIEDVEP